MVARAFALNAHDERFGRVLVEEVVDLAHQTTEVFGSCQGDGENAVHQGQLVLVWVLRINRLGTDIKKPDTMLELLPWANGLATNRWRREVIGGSVMGSWD